MPEGFFQQAPKRALKSPQNSLWQQRKLEETPTLTESVPLAGPLDRAWSGFFSKLPRRFSALTGRPCQLS